MSERGRLPLRAGDPRRLGRYRVEARLGEGGMGTVYLGQTEQGRQVAIKVARSELARTADFRARFRRETQAARRVARFCTAEVIDADPEAEAPYLVTEFIDGPTLGEVIVGRGPMSGADLEHLAVAVISALTAIHGAGVVHRDLKPSNVMLSPMGPRVIDFGIAQGLDETALTQGTRRAGTPGFMAPEQVVGASTTEAVDVFAWGGVVLYAASGRPPFGGGPTPTQLYRVVHDEPDLSPLEPGLRDVVADAMRKEPRRRPSAQEIFTRLVTAPTTLTVGPGADPEITTTVRPGAAPWAAAVAAAEAARSEPAARPAAARTGPARTAPTSVGPARTGPAQTRPAQTGSAQVRSSRNQASQNQAAQNQPGQVRPNVTGPNVTGPNYTVREYTGSHPLSPGRPGAMGQPGRPGRPGQGGRPGGADRPDRAVRPRDTGRSDRPVWTESVRPPERAAAWPPARTGTGPVARPREASRPEPPRGRSAGTVITIILVIIALAVAAVFAALLVTRRDGTDNGAGRSPGLPVGAITAPGRPGI